MARFAAILTMSLLSWLLGGCGNPLDSDVGGKLRKKPPSRSASPEVRLDAGAAAVVIVRVECVKGGGGRGELRDQWRVSHVLEVRRGGRIEPIEIAAGVLGFGSDADLAMADATYALQATPTAVAFSSDAGKTWRCVVLPDRGAPITCTHRDYSPAPISGEKYPTHGRS